MNALQHASDALVRLADLTAATGQPSPADAIRRLVQ
jgi:hypothetical protein